MLNIRFFARKHFSPFQYAQKQHVQNFFGSRQHGLPVFRVGDLATDLAVLRQAQEAAAQLISQDRPLPSPLAQAIESLLAGSADTLN